MSATTSTCSACPFRRTSTACSTRSPASQTKSAGWGRADETWNALATVESLGAESWFRLGDRDLGLHAVRTQALREGVPLSAVTAKLAAALRVETTILPATDGSAAHVARHDERELPLPGVVRRARAPRPGRPRPLRRCDRSAPAPGVLEALHEAELILIAPSNPFVSIGPILAVERIRSALERRRVPCVAVSPLIGGLAVKGPAAGMLQRLQGGTTAAHVAGCYPA